MRSLAPRLFVPHRPPCKECIKAGNKSCFFDARSRTQKCARCIINKCRCSRKAKSAEEKKTLFAERVEARYGAGEGAEAAWIKNEVAEFRNA
jgi:hypothetical protein